MSISESLKEERNIKYYIRRYDTSYITHEFVETHVIDYLANGGKITLLPPGFALHSVPNMFEELMGDLG